jgi:hypothetical protein
MGGRKDGYYEANRVVRDHSKAPENLRQHGNIREVKKEDLKRKNKATNGGQKKERNKGRKKERKKERKTERKRMTKIRGYLIFNLV